MREYIYIYIYRYIHIYIYISSKPVAPTVGAVLSRCKAPPPHRATTSEISSINVEGIVRSIHTLHAGVAKAHSILHAAVAPGPKGPDFHYNTQLSGVYVHFYVYVHVYV